MNGRIRPKRQRSQSCRRGSRSCCEASRRSLLVDSRDGLRLPLIGQRSAYVRAHASRFLSRLPRRRKGSLRWQRRVLLFRSRIVRFGALNRRRHSGRHALPPFLSRFTPRNKLSYQGHEGQEDRQGTPQRLVVCQQIAAERQPRQRHNEREDLTATLHLLVVLLGTALHLVIVRLLLLSKLDNATPKSRFNFVIATQDRRCRNQSAMRLQDMRLVGTTKLSRLQPV